MASSLSAQVQQEYSQDRTNLMTLNLLSDLSTDFLLILEFMKFVI